MRPKTSLEILQQQHQVQGIGGRRNETESGVKIGGAAVLGMHQDGAYRYDIRSRQDPLQGIPQEPFPGPLALKPKVHR